MQDRVREKMQERVDEMQRLCGQIMAKYDRYKEGLQAPPPPNDLNKNRVHALRPEINRDLEQISRLTKHIESIFVMGE